MFASTVLKHIVQWNINHVDRIFWAVILTKWTDDAKQPKIQMDFFVHGNFLSIESAIFLRHKSLKNMVLRWAEQL